MKPTTAAKDEVGRSVAVLVELQLTENVPSVAETAAFMDMSVRTLQRRLKDEGTSFSDVLDRTRRLKLNSTVAASGALPPDMHHRLGYSQASVLRRAIRRWESKDLSGLESEHDSDKKR